MQKYIEMLEEVKSSMNKEMELYPVATYRRKVIRDYFDAISILQDKIIPGTSGKELTIRFLSGNKDKEELPVILEGLQIPANTGKERIEIPKKSSKVQPKINKLISYLNR